MISSIGSNVLLQVGKVEFLCDPNVIPKMFFRFKFYQDCHCNSVLYRHALYHTPLRRIRRCSLRVVHHVVHGAAYRPIRATHCTTCHKWSNRSIAPMNVSTTRLEVVADFPTFRLFFVLLFWGKRVSHLRGILLAPATIHCTRGKYMIQHSIKYSQENCWIKACWNRTLIRREAQQKKLWRKNKI